MSNLLPIQDGIVPLSEILPDEPLLMMGAGPVPIPYRVAHANSIVINHLGEVMSRVIEQVKTMGRYVFQTESKYIFGVAGPASAAMEMAICNLIPPGSEVLSIVNGYFSKRMFEMTSRLDVKVDMIKVDDDKAADPEEIIAKLRSKKYRALTITQGETSNTIWNHALKEISLTAAKMDCLVIVDAVCTLSTMPLDMDNWQVDAVITGGQKGLSSIPGVSMLAFSEKAWEVVTGRNDTLKHWCMDAKLANNFWNNHGYHYTAPVSGILALHEALHLIQTETLERRFLRHKICSEALQLGIEGMGLELLVPREVRLNSVVGIKIPEGVDPDKTRKLMSEMHKVEISGSFGVPTLRIGQMGEQCRAHNLFRTLHALGTSMKAMKFPIDLPTGIAEMEKHLSDEKNRLYLH